MPPQSAISILDEVGFFEGTEKLLEIWFSNENDGLKGDLRKIPRHELDNLLNIVSAEIVSHTHNEFIDSYVLSESSMFISRNRFIIKTCGITKLLYAVRPIIILAKKYGMFKKVENFFYSRRVYLRPDDQIGVHRSFQDEVDFLKKIVPEGRAHTLGKNENEQWYLFATEAKHMRSDNTLEILMSDLDETAMLSFSKYKHSTSEEVVKNTGISRFIPGSINDGILFDPIGYSLNGLFKETYYTIHVTPQPMCSYVSFETNINNKCYEQLIDKVLSVFKPGRFIITLFSSQSAPCGCSDRTLDHINLSNYRCDDQQSRSVGCYSLAYRLFVKDKK